MEKDIWYQVELHIAESGYDLEKEDFHEFIKDKWEETFKDLEPAPICRLEVSRYTIDNIDQKTADSKQVAIKITVDHSVLNEVVGILQDVNDRFYDAHSSPAIRIFEMKYIHRLNMVYEGPKS